MSFNIERTQRPVFNAKATAAERQTSQAAFLAAMQRAAPATSVSSFSRAVDEPLTEAQLIEKLRSGMLEDQAANARAVRMRWALVLDDVRPFLRQQSRAARRAAMLRLLSAFGMEVDDAAGDQEFANEKLAWIRQGIEYAAILSGVAIDPAEARRREGEESFAAEIRHRGLMGGLDGGRDDPRSIAGDIRAFLDETMGGAGEGAAARKWMVLNRLYQRDWTDAAPTMAAIETVAAEDFDRGLDPTLHLGPEAHAAAHLIGAKAAVPGHAPDLEAIGIPNQQFYDLMIGARHASAAVQRELAHMLSQDRLVLSAISHYVVVPLRDGDRPLQENGLEMIGRLEWLTRDMDGGLAAQVVAQILDEMARVGGAAQALDFTGVDEGGNAAEGSALNGLQAMVKRIEDAGGSRDLIDRMRGYGFPV